MELMQFRKLRDGLQANASPASIADLRKLEHDLRESLMATGFFEEVEVDCTDNPDGMVIAMCTFPAQMSESDVAARLEQAWEDRLRFGFWAAHNTLVDSDQVEFQAASRTGINGHFVTVHVVAQKAPIPAQRLP